MFGNLKAAAGSWVSDKAGSFFKKKEKETLHPVLFDDDDEFSKKAQTIRPLYEKKHSAGLDLAGLSKQSQSGKQAEGIQAPMSERTHSRGAFGSLSLSTLFLKKSGSEVQERTVFTYKFIDTAKNIWEKNDLDEILSYDDLNYGFDEEFRASLEEAAKNKFKAVQVSQERIDEYMEDFDHLEVIMSTIDIMASNSLNESGLDEDCRKDVSTFFVNVPEEVFVSIFFKEMIEPRFEYGSPPSSPNSQDSVKMQFFKDVHKQYARLVETFSFLEVDLGVKKRSVERSITMIIKNKNCDFWGTCQDYFRMCDESNMLTQKVCTLRNQIEICKKTAVSKTIELMKKFKNRKQKQQAVDLLMKAKEKLTKIINFCKLDLISANQVELPVVYEVLVISYINLKKPDPELDNLAVKKVVLSTIIERIEIIKRRLKGMLYTYLTLFNSAQEEDPSDDLLDVLDLYTSISEKAQDIQEKYNVESEQFAEDVILLKAHCLQLLHMDDSLNCVHNDVIMSYF